MCVYQSHYKTTKTNKTKYTMSLQTKDRFSRAGNMGHWRQSFRIRNFTRSRSSIDRVDAEMALMQRDTRIEFTRKHNSSDVRTTVKLTLSTPRALYQMWRKLLSKHALRLSCTALWYLGRRKYELFAKNLI